MSAVHRIVLVGVESTGKTTLARALAAELRWAFVEEQARIWLDARAAHGADAEPGDEYGHDARRVPYGETDLTTLSDLQWQAEERAASEAGNLVADTDQCVLRVWSEVRFGRCDPRILERLAQRPAAHYLLPAPDLPWVPDPQRETPDRDERHALHARYRELLAGLGHPWAQIEGTGPVRLDAAWRALRRFGIRR